MPGDAPDPVLVEARRALLDALEALRPHMDRIVLVGAQAVYLHTDEVTLGVALFTKDADLALVPPLGEEPEIEKAMRDAGFRPGSQPGIWLEESRQVDLLVPEGLAPIGGRRSAQLEGHGKRAARKVLGLEGAAVDNAIRVVPALDPADHRSVRLRVASPAALLVAKLHKLGERQQEPRGDRLSDKDAFDIYRLLQLPSADLARGMHKLLADARSAEVAGTALRFLQQLFGMPDARGCEMAGRYVDGVADPETVRLATASLAEELRGSLIQSQQDLASGRRAGHGPSPRGSAR
ncbi:MAG: hypothetical protein ABIQ17_04710 [Candidatus Limnocylindrales bacterium]